MTAQSRFTPISLAELMAMELPEPLVVIPGIAPEGLVLLVGPPKVGKTRLVSELVLAVSGVEPALDSITVPEHGDVLGLFLEDNMPRVQGRFGGLLQGRPAPPGLHVVTDWPQSDQGGITMLDRWLADHPGTRAVAIDTLQRFRSPVRGRASGSVYALDYEALAPLQRLALHRHVAIFLLHHTRKMAATDPIDLVNGTAALGGAADTVLILQRAQRSQADATLTVRSRDLEDAELALRRDVISGGWTLLGDAGRCRLSDDRAAVCEVLAAGGALTPTEISQAIGKSYQATKVLVWRMAQDGQLFASPTGRYSLPAGEPCYPSNPSNPLFSGSAGDPGYTGYAGYTGTEEER